jgi:hypothetical protein
MSLPEMIAVSSSNVESIGYDENIESLYVKFINGSIYEYKNVPKMVFEQLLFAPSIGSYMHRNIKGSFAYEKVN